MTLTVETGAGLVDADSYASLEFASDYLTRQGFPSWDEASEANKEAALRRGTRYVDATYAGRWLGQRTHGRAQALAWPRQNVTDGEGHQIPDDEVPPEVRMAAVEAARRELASPWGLMPDVVPSELERRVSVGPISVEYAESGPEGARPVVEVIDALLLNLLVAKVGGTGTRWLKRA